MGLNKYFEETYVETAWVSWKLLRCTLLKIMHNLITMLKCASRIVVIRYSLLIILVLRLPSSICDSITLQSNWFPSSSSLPSTQVRHLWEKPVTILKITNTAESLRQLRSGSDTYMILSGTCTLYSYERVRGERREGSRQHSMHAI